MSPLERHKWKFLWLLILLGAGTGVFLAFGSRAEAYLRQALSKVGVNVPLKVDLEILKYVDQRGEKKLRFDPKLEFKDPYNLQERFF